MERMACWKRTLVKTIAYRLVSIVVTAGVAWAVTGNAAVALGLGSIDALVKLGVYAGFEAAWNSVVPEAA
jgi:uncharacterized membrane protein